MTEQTGPQGTQRAGLLAAEEPPGIRVNGEAISLTMRTPGDDIDLAAGFLVGEGMLREGQHPRIAGAERVLT